MEQVVVKKEPEELFDDSKGDISLNYEYKMREIKEEMDGSNNSIDYNESWVKEESETFTDQGHGELSKEDSEENKGMIETKVEVEYHGVQCDVSGKKKLFECNMCPKKLQTRVGLFSHKKYVHRKNELEKFKCDNCDFVTVRKSIIKHHLNTHDKESYLKCRYCQYMAARLTTLHAHILNKHRLENEGENKIKITSKIHTCTNCSYSNVSKSHYDRHLIQCLNLKNVKQYECHVCDYKTLHKNHLTTHIKSHNNIKELKCFFCDYQTNAKQSLDNHILRRHSNLLNDSNKNFITSKVHSCQHCKYKTTISIQLIKHLRSNH